MPRKGAHDFHNCRQGMRVCLDCPQAIPTYGNKLRCAACASRRYDDLKHARNERKKAELLKARGDG